LTKKNPFEQAMGNILDRLGEEQDEDLIMYEKMTPFIFRGLARRYGQEEVNRYIKIMEAKRQGIPQLGDKE
jgi:hypothetical protein